jgi:ABC-type nitrate/sulfonate/bicarbonate transport system permease component
MVFIRWVKTFFIGIIISEGNILNKRTDKLYPIGAILVFIVLWQLAISLNIINAFSIPSPTQIVVALFTEMPILSSHLLTTLYEGLLGILVSVILSFIFAVLMDLSPKFKRTIYPLMILSQTVPIIVLAPLLAMWFGFGVMPKVVVVTLVCFFPITVSMTEGLDSVDRELIDLMRSMDATKLQIFTKIKFPATMISFFSGLKIAVTYSIMGAIIGEWMGGKAGLGVYMMRVKNSFAYDKMFAAILLVSVTSILIFKLIEYLQHVTMPWHKNGHDKEELE